MAALSMPGCPGMSARTLPTGSPPAASSATTTWPTPSRASGWPRPSPPHSAGGDWAVQLWNPTEGTQQRVLEGHKGGVSSLAWGTLDGGPVLVSGGDETVRLWGPSRVGEINLRTAVFTISFESDGWLAIAGWAGLAVLVIRAGGSPKLKPRNEAHFPTTSSPPAVGAASRV